METYPGREFVLRCLILGNVLLYCKAHQRKEVSCIFIKGKKSNKDSLHAKPVACDSCMEQSSRKVKQQRNQQRKQEYHSGISMQCLTKKCNLSLYAVRKIIYQK